MFRDLDRSLGESSLSACSRHFFFENFKKNYVDYIMFISPVSLA